MKLTFGALVFCFIFFFNLNTSLVYANNIKVSSTILTGRNTATRDVQIQFNLTWENSFFLNSGSSNYDAAWVFVKYKVGLNGDWNHASLSRAGGNIVPSYASLSQSDNKGVFIYRNNVGSGTFSLTGIQLRWNYGIDGVADDSKIYIKVFAIEMVSIPKSTFVLGSGAQNTGEFRQANDVSVNGSATTFTVTNSVITVQGNNSSSSSNNLSTRLGFGNDLSSGTSTASLHVDFPTGYSDFYCMKYEITQGEYRDFLNTLSYTQQASRTSNPPNSTIGTGAFTTSGSYRNGIEIKESGIASTSPAVYACDATNDNVFDQSNDGSGTACNYLSWDDLAAYLDWAALRPMSELEYEKICRGSATPIANEYAWGNAASTNLDNILNTFQSNEVSNTANANAVMNNAYSSGPVRVGIFATATSSRVDAGSSYYGVMEMSGNLWEQVVPISNASARAFSYNTGDGILSSNGDANVSTWPSAANIGIRGGSFNSSGSLNYLSDRTNINSGNSSRNNNIGGRGVKALIAKVDYLIVGGGGGTARNGREVGGAGGGQVATGSKSLIAQSYSIVVGAGGSITPGNGGQSSAFGIIALGGNGNSSVNGASSGNGNAGGTDNNTYGTAGGGAGAGGAGQNGSSSKAGDGGIGIQSSISGIASYYGGGGGGGADWDIGSIVYGSGGQGGGGQGGQGHNDGSHQPVAGTANTGGGAGGPGQNGTYSGKVGGSGVVIIRYKTDGSDGISNTSSGGTKTTSGTYTIHTFTSSGTFVCVLSF